MNKGFTEYLKLYNEIIKQSKAKNLSAENKVKIAILRSYSCEMLQTLVTVDAHEHNMFAEFFIGGYNQINQEILNVKSGLYAFSPDFILIAANIEHIAPDFLTASLNLESINESQITTVKEEISNLINILLANTGAHIFITNFVKPYFSPENSYELSNINGIKNAVYSLNIQLCALANENARLNIIAIDDIILKIGQTGSYNLKMLHVAKNPYNFCVYKQISKMFVSGVLAVYGQRTKCIALDLDNTLWKGIIGEDGINGIEITESHKMMQRHLMYLSKTGILLAINSKNNYNDAIEVLNNHPDMVLKLSDFSAIKINWHNKAENLKQIAAELNIGLDSIVFIDDSEFECGMVNELLPQVRVICLSNSFLHYSDVIKNLPYVNFHFLTKEDKVKKNLYAAQVKRSNLKSASKSVTDYLSKLEIEVSIKEADNYSIARVSQLTQKTNQFNLTCKRYTETEIAQMLNNGYKIFTVNDKDKFGDNGLTGVIIINTNYKGHNNKTAWFIDTFLLSCRVMNRDIEKAFMHFVVDAAKKENVSMLIGIYVESAKNKPVMDLYNQFGFIYNNGQYEYNTDKQFIYPHYIHICD